MILQRAGMLVLFVMCALADVIALAWMFCAIVAGSNRALHIAFAKDQVANTAIGGHWDETISSRAWRNRDKNKIWYYARIFIDALFFMDQNHCQKSFENEKIEAREWLQGVEE